MEHFSIWVRTLARWLDRVAGVCIAALALLIVVNIILRAALNRPIAGTIDLAGVLTTLGIGFALAHCASQNGQIAIEFVTDKMPGRAAAGLKAFFGLAAFIFWLVSAWFLAAYAQSMAGKGVVTPTIQMPLYPVLYLLAVCFVVLSLVILVRMAESIRKAAR